MYIEPGCHSTGDSGEQCECSPKWCILGTKLLKKTNRKPYTIYQMVPLSVTFDPDFKVNILNIEYLRNDTR